MYKAARYSTSGLTEQNKMLCVPGRAVRVVGGGGGGNVGSAAKGLPWGFGHLQGIRIINESVLLSLFP